MSSSKYSWLQIPWTAVELAVDVDDEDLVRAVDPGHLHRARRGPRRPPSRSIRLTRAAIGRPRSARRRPTSPRAARAGGPARRPSGTRATTGSRKPRTMNLRASSGGMPAALEVEELGLVDRADRARVGRAAAVRLVDLEARDGDGAGLPSTGSSRTRRGSCRCRPRVFSMVIRPFMYDARRVQQGALGEQVAGRVAADVAGVRGQVEQLVVAAEDDLDLLDRCCGRPRGGCRPGCGRAATAELGERPVERRALADARAGDAGRRPVRSRSSWRLATASFAPAPRRTSSRAREQGLRRPGDRRAPDGTSSSTIDASAPRRAR